ncbi:hypothetical protein H9Y04_34575 [Streptomyces sp. TRM66268-LWL]|uniref:Uncharacterized protein n=1 Tax=Streptomyces polyasparticus TaxID=2767826 RepID=A0ABR7SSM0_9ACTN|nr:hypothetical protein [Streptomyces polyasparticus]MBC9717670.1 hypothetical protein [Streptomyces polyasparticus]
MYEPIRAKSVHTPGPDGDFPHRTREEELELQLAGHLAALLAVTDELRGLAPSGELDDAAAELEAAVTRLRGGRTPVRATVTSATDLTALHERAHALAGRALVVAASRADTSAAILAARRMEAHALSPAGV